VEKLLELLSEQNVRILDYTKQTTIFNEENNPLTSFAIDDAIATAVGNGIAPTTFRLWSHDNTVVLGIPDSRLPYIKEGVQFLHGLGYKTIIRNSGGLAVALDSGVLNISMILPDAKHTSIYDGYDMMYAFIQQLFKKYTSSIKAYEIIGSYCPGDYDLSINGVKFAGISQRRVRNGVAVQIYVDIEGKSNSRANVIKKFYQISKRNAETTYTYPSINPDVMASVNKLLQTELTVESCIKEIQHFITGNAASVVKPEILHEEEVVFTGRLQQMKQRNEKIIQLLESEK